MTRVFWKCQRSKLGGVWGCTYRSSNWAYSLKRNILLVHVQSHVNTSLHLQTNNNLWSIELKQQVISLNLINFHAISLIKTKKINIIVTAYMRWWSNYYLLDGLQFLQWHMFGYKDKINDVRKSKVLSLEMNRVVSCHQIKTLHKPHFSFLIFSNEKCNFCDSFFFNRGYNKIITFLSFGAKGAAYLSFDA